MSVLLLCVCVCVWVRGKNQKKTKKIDRVFAVGVRELGWA